MGSVLSAGSVFLPVLLDSSIITIPRKGKQNTEAGQIMKVKTNYTLRYEIQGLPGKKRNSVLPKTDGKACQIS